MAAITSAVALTKVEEEKIRRFDINQIFQHYGLMSSFILLAVTGLPQKFNEWAVSQWWVGLWGGFEVLRATHRFAAWVIIIICLYHLAYILYSTVILKRPFPVKMIPLPQDFVKFFHEISYFLGFRKDKPEFDRFNWKEKFDYWAIFWGMPVMAGSGFIMMYPVFFTKLLPGWIVPSALIAHGDEAILAVTWIFLVHIFFNHFKPKIFPINTSIFTGKVSKERYLEEHPLEYDELLKKEQETAS